jgi:hypothetical protein
VSFNRVFADARNEILLLNILRAEYNDPQQFSTISSVTGNMRPQMSVTGTLDNLIIGATKVFNPSGQFALRNPSVTIGPLETKEFRAGMMKPVTAQFVDDLLGQGWSRPVVLHLVLSAVICKTHAAAELVKRAAISGMIRRTPSAPATDESIVYFNNGAFPGGVESADAQKVLNFVRHVEWDLPTGRARPQGRTRRYGCRRQRGNITTSIQIRGFINGHNRE